MHDEVEWRTVRWPDGTCYEGLTRGAKSCDGHGVIYYPNGDRYEGEWEANKMNGYGAFIARDGTVSRGQFQEGYFSGCGVKLARLDADKDNQASSSPSTQPSYHALEGRFFADDFVGPGISGCSVEASREAAREADVAAALARSMQTSMGRGQFLSRKHGQNDDSAAAARKVQDPNPNPNGGGFKWRWPWEQGSSKEEGLAQKDPEALNGLSPLSLSVARGGDWEGARERTRPLNDSEREKVRGLIKGLMISSTTGARQESQKIKI